MKIKLVFAFVLLTTSVFKMSAQEISFDFEDGNKRIWTKAKEVFMVTNEKAVSGKSSLKYNVTELPANEKENFQLFLGGNENVKWSSGTYIISLKFMADENLKATGFNINVMKPFAAANFKINKVEKGKWIDLSQELVIAEDSERLSLSVSGNPKWGGTGTFYVDDIKIVKK
ncbi:hypothetical protein SLW70_15920 [Flavobacterium sp. NG2]|uniref:hypothetical protein n=1 Tax=Flavobacterium sp. NG2 TaxID=3097547 RepID=UPI002A82C107|nr:hypothetical protein [Flavobacterium sp. NG2]WPR71402.1 hypothetical protein SLW70_15920 [Flavobacterium sp. NG2]